MSELRIILDTVISAKPHHNIGFTPSVLYYGMISCKQSNSSLASARMRQDVGRMSIPPVEYLPSPPRTMGMAARAPPPSPYGSLTRIPQHPSQSLSTRPSPIPHPTPSPSDIHTRRNDPRAYAIPSATQPVSSPMSPELTRTPESLCQGSSCTRSRMRRPESSEPLDRAERGIPIPNAGRQQLPPQSSPEFRKGSPNGFGRRHRGSFTDHSASSPRQFTAMTTQDSSGSRGRRLFEPGPEIPLSPDDVYRLYRD
ncbi:hypothetical protein BXZ70DRAFT_1030861 [Cristinia sonorae]|uniref:Uncharacterized protein n=1 Tax=Cristinia sonorae TaxID=1940300 RepID=A0A8K0XP29_9AGAR|nr:hypothetical protein BXZ70DRAFT_1030861 [Cristinia sonorae]